MIAKKNILQSKVTSHLPKLHFNQKAAIEHERLTSLIQSMGDGVIAIDEKARIAVYNGAALNILDSNTGIEDKLIADVLKLYDKTNQPVDVTEMINTTTTSMTTRDLCLIYSDGTKLNLYISIAPVRLGYGKKGQKGHVILIRDITREKSLEEERDEFIRVVSHELRTPIAIAEGNISNAQFIADKNFDLSKIKDALKQAHTQTIFLAGLINDLSTLSRAERGKLSLDIEPINTHELCKDLYKNYTPSAEAKGLKLTLDLGSSLELLYSSKLYVREILQNFITNAIKYTEKGSITVGADQKDNGVQFWVQDTGIGISKPDQEKVFNKFFRSDDYRTRENNGTGLGLYVTMKLVRMIKADIDLESEINKGSVFRIFIPNLQ